jgi:hypothetical protein
VGLDKGEELEQVVFDEDELSGEAEMRGDWVLVGVLNVL